MVSALLLTEVIIWYQQTRIVCLDGLVSKVTQFCSECIRGVLCCQDWLMYLSPTVALVLRIFMICIRLLVACVYVLFICVLWLYFLDCLNLFNIWYHFRRFKKLRFRIEKMSGGGEKGTGTTKTPADFLKSIRGRPVVVKLNSGVDYRGPFL